MTNMPTYFAAPPRAVPLSLRIVNVFNPFAQIGWGVFGFGMIFFWVFATNADFSFITFRDVAKAVGRVTLVENTNASQNRQTIKASHYEYSVDGRLYSGKSYSNGDAPAEGSQVTVEYVNGNPQRSRIAGLRQAMFGPGAAIVVIFPLIGLLIVIFATRSTIARNHVLRDGIVAQGTLVDKEPTNVTINDRRVWKLTFEFTDRTGQKRTATASTTDTDRLEDEPTETLLYDPVDPSRAFVLDEAPARPKLENGQLAGRPVAGALSLIIPGLVILVHGGILLVKLSHLFK